MQQDEKFWTSQQFWNDEYKANPEQTGVKDLVLETELAMLAPGRVLDLGCGTGNNALKLAAQGWSVTGVDWADHAIELANKSARQQGVDATFIASDITTWQPPHSFDLVISTYALPGGDANPQVLQIASEALAPGGTLLVVEWDRSMSQVWDFAPEDLVTPQQIVEYLPELSIELAETRTVSNMFDAIDDPKAAGVQEATIAVVRAKKASS